MSSPSSTSLDASSPDALQASLEQLLIRDRHPCRQQLAKIRRLAQQGKPFDRLLQRLQQRMEASLALAEQRRQRLPEVVYDDRLPVVQKREQIAEAIQHHQVVILAGETGSGKTTQLPKICLELGRGVVGRIGHTQPRRLAARTVASRIADELNSELGDLVGYQVRFSDHSTELSLVKLMTDGILLAEIQRDPHLNNYDTLIIDEAHERSLNIDFLMGYVKRLLSKRPDLKVIITSATIDVQRFAEHFAGAPVLEVSGRTFPVDVHYRDPTLHDEDDLAAQVLGAYDQILRLERQLEGTPGGDVLVFLPGEREIRECALALRRKQLRNVDILPLYARLSLAEQNRVFASHPGRRIILSTNVAETSITVPGIRFVIDAGTARISRYSYRTKVQRLPVEPVSQASASQRAGRCGRVGPGICVRLYSEADFQQRPEFTDAEILRTNLASVILQMRLLGLGDIEAFPFVDAPDTRLVRDGLKLLQELGALDEQMQLTEVGRIMGRMPVDPRLARMLVEAQRRGCLRQVLVIVAGLSVQDPRDRPADKQQAADEKHRAYWHEQSDFLSYWNLWQSYETQRQELSQSQLRKYCQRNFLSFLRMREWRDIHYQLRLAIKPLEWKENAAEADYAAIHCSLLTGLLGHIGRRDDKEKREYLGARNRKFQVFPGSGLVKKNLPWLMGFELVETSRLFARCVAKIDPAWLVELGGELVKREYYEPHWDVKAGQVKAFERITLYGLVVADKQKRPYGQIDAKVSHEIFVRAALVEGRWRSQAAFYRHNQQLVRDIEKLESKSRRHDLLVDDAQIEAFYRERVPANIHNVRGFERWRKKVEASEPQLLFMQRGDLLLRETDHLNHSLYPDHLVWQELKLPLSYRFEPGKRDDGVNVEVPLALLNQMPVHLFEWLVPGMLADKCVELVKGLPKTLRKQLVPVPDRVAAALPLLQPNNQPLTSALADALRRTHGIMIAKEAWPTEIDGHYLMNFRLVDETGCLLETSRDFDQLLLQYQDQIEDHLHQASDAEYGASGLKDWTFGDLPLKTQFRQGDIEMVGYPALRDDEDSVSLILLSDEFQARRVTERGLVRLLILHLRDSQRYLAKQLLKDRSVTLCSGPFGGRGPLVDDLTMAAFRQTFLAEQQWPRSRAEFDQRVQQQRSQIVTLANELEKPVAQAVALHQQVSAELKTLRSPAFLEALADMREQLDCMMAPGFCYDTPVEWLRQLPRFLQAMLVRIDRLKGQVDRDRQAMLQVQRSWQPFADLLAADCWIEGAEQYRWLVEELRVSLFAQSLGTSQPISEKRLKKLWQQLQSEQR